jgi:hypothetical protein
VLVTAAVATALVVPTGAPPARAAVPPITVSDQGPAATPAPVRIRAPGIDAAVAPVGIDGSGTLAVPADPALAGWFSAGPAPGAAGPAVLAAHVDWAGAPGAFAGLRDLRPGNDIAVERADGSVVRFAVTRVVRAPKDAFPTVEVYGPTSGAELRLVTCGGRFDRSAGSYEDNVVVFATQVR